MGVEPWAIVSIVLSTMLAALAAFTLKKGAHESQLLQFRISAKVLLAIVLYILSSGFFLLALMGGELSVLVPITAVEYVWIVFLARRFLQERISVWKGAGMVCIAAGIILVGLGS